MKNKTNEERQTPIIDGDARPDQNIDGLTDKKSKSKNQPAKKPFTKERGADINTLEDYKDAKQP